MLIEHNKYERRRTGTTEYLLWAMLVICWAGYLYFHQFDLWSFAMGGATTFVLISSVYDRIPPDQR